MRHSRPEPAPGLNGGGNPEAFDALPALIEKLRNLSFPDFIDPTEHLRRLLGDGFKITRFHEFFGYEIGTDSDTGNSSLEPFL
jgi:hypothetical protein